VGGGEVGRPPEGAATIEPGSRIRLVVPKVGFYPSDHPLHTTGHGPLIPRGATLFYVGPFPDRAGVHIAHSPPQGTVSHWVVYFGEEELITGPDPSADAAG
jgi:hypothetical protein